MGDIDDADAACPEAAQDIEEARRLLRAAGGHVRVSVPSVAPLGILVAASLWLALFPGAKRFPRIVPLFATLAAMFSSLLLFRAERSGGT
ncbi:MAG: hypothetical protein HC933_21585, partial [Pleurocapsa sp. SU_196_0]|nr:hypothetical protein [Pleurocapsa sp. SU_196_0]